jgi:hypothetical protein
MHMSEDVQLGTHSLNGSAKLLASHVRGNNIFLVQNAEWRSMGYKYVCRLRDLVPVSLAGSAALHGEGHIGKEGRHGTAPEIEPFQSHAGVLQVNSIRKMLFDLLGLGLEKQVLVSRNDDLVLVRQVTEQVIEIIDFLGRAPGRHEVTCMDQNIAIRQIQLTVKTMGIAYADDAYAGRAKPYLDFSGFHKQHYRLSL